MTALLAASPGNAMGENATLEVATKFSLGVGRHGVIFPIVMTEREEGLEVHLDDLIQRRSGGISPLVLARSTSFGVLGGHGG